MAQFLIRNSLNPQKVIKCGITFEQITPKSYEGEGLWVVELATDELHKNGGNIPPEFINVTKNMHQFLVGKRINCAGYKII